MGSSVGEVRPANQCQQPTHHEAGRASSLASSIHCDTDQQHTSVCGPLTCRVLWELLAAVPADVRSQVVSLAIDGTSATAVLLDTASGAVLQPPKLYNEAQGKEAVEAAKVQYGMLGGGP